MPRNKFHRCNCGNSLFRVTVRGFYCWLCGNGYQTVLKRRIKDPRKWATCKWVIEEIPLDVKQLNQGY